MKKAPPERSERMLLSIARRDDGFCNPSIPTLKKALSQDGAFLVVRRFQFTQKRKGMKNGRLNAMKEFFYPLHVGFKGYVFPLLPL
jgi:hypothetical protein